MKSRALASPLRVGRCPARGVRVEERGRAVGDLLVAGLGVMLGWSAGPARRVRRSPTACDSAPATQRPFSSRAGVSFVAG
jgi:hypothetical protein